MDLLKETDKMVCKVVATPINPNLKLGLAEEDVAVDREMYQRLMGRLIYLSHTIPDIAYTECGESIHSQSNKSSFTGGNQDLTVSQRNSRERKFNSKGMEDSLLRRIQMLIMLDLLLIGDQPLGIALFLEATS